MAHVSPEVFLAISRQKARYGRYADTKQWDKWEKEIFLPDARFSFFDTNGKPLKVGAQTFAFDSSKSLATFFKKFFASVDSLHNICPGDLEQVAPNEVKAVFGFEDQVMAKGLGAWAEIRGGGFYYETWKLVDGQWLIQDLRMERTYQKMTFLVSLTLTIASVFGIAL